MLFLLEFPVRIIYYNLEKQKLTTGTQASQE